MAAPPSVVAADEMNWRPRWPDYSRSWFYFNAANWLENLRIGTARGGDMGALIEQALLAGGISLAPESGHLDEEWLVRPLPYSTVCLQSGMILQIDIIPSRPATAAQSIEDTVALADSALRRELAQRYPELWQRIVARRFVYRRLALCFLEEVLPFQYCGYLSVAAESRARVGVSAPY